MIDFTSAEKSNIADVHNKLRNDLATGKVPNFRSAAKMGTMIWDDELAAMADLNVRRCVYEHDACHNTQKYQMSGQNLAYIKGYNHGTFNRIAVVKELDVMINDWFSEYLDADMNIIRNFPINNSSGVSFKFFFARCFDKIINF